MRIWSLHPRYLDAKGLVALWRETLLAKNVLEGKTKGYRCHPQLYRFRAHAQPLRMIQAYLKSVYEEAMTRNYRFDSGKFENNSYPRSKIKVTCGQIAYERKHLEQKLITRAPEKLREWQHLNTISVHPIFEIIEGDIEPWERV
ncbi:MAG: pyrimidine dimer DNA glycosylase/endonuclease V [Taibaiella sp.]|nr:pyrimidine dimer DNA glycosylase/endonuclease V [Taibaiella sp.]